MNIQFISGFSAVYIFVIFLLYAFLFFKQEKAYKLITIYIYINSVIRFFNLLNDEYFLGGNSLFMITQFYILLWIYYLFLGKKYLIYFAIFTIPFSIFTLFFLKKLTIQIIFIEAAITYLCLFITTSNYLIKQIDTKKTYFYFNTGLLFYVFSSIILFFILISLELISKIDSSEAFVYINNILEFIFFSFLLKEWFTLFRKNNQEKQIKKNA